MKLSGSVWPAPAKLNLFLHVLGRRSDGYHELQTLFQLIDLHDEIEIEPTAGPAIVRLGGGYDVAEEDDLTIRAARMLQQRTGAMSGVRIRISKHIPLGGGLGGGSSDAATALLVLNRAWDCGLDLESLARMGLALGADVPLFIYGHTAVGTGVGDRLESVALGPTHYVLIDAGFPVSTREVFAHPALSRNSKPLDAASARRGDGRNDCESVVRALYPELDRMMRDLVHWGHPRLTGTGSTVFLAMPDRDSAIRTADALKCRYNVRAVRGLDRSPAHMKLAN